MRFPIFNSSRSPFPVARGEAIDVESLNWVLRCDPRLENTTNAVRSGDAASKTRLGITCLGGPYHPLPPEADHGRCVHWHNSATCYTGYRNTQHIDWGARNGIVLVDVDNVTEDPRAVQVLLEQCADAIAVMWISARGRGLKVGVAVDPVPADTPSTYDAWTAAYAYITNIFSRSGLRVDEHFRIDNTPAAAQVAILAHDPHAVVRVPNGRVGWRAGERSTAPRPIRSGSRAGVGLPIGIQDDHLLLLMTHADSPMDLVELFPWQEGYRSSSMHQFGTRCALRGFDYQQGRATAFAQAFLTDMAAEYGIEESLRHYDRGYQSASEMLTGFPATG